MQKTPTKTRRAVVFIGLAATIALCVFSGVHKRVRPPRARSSMERLDALAKPHFDEAERNVPSVVADLTSNGNFLKLCWLMAGDKVSGAHKTQKFIESKIRTRIVEPCQRGAGVYGCGVDSSAIRDELLASGRDNAVITACATGSLAVEAVFIKSTLASLRSVLGATVGKLSSAYGSGAACAAADGPLPIGDVIGVALAAGGTIWSISDMEMSEEPCRGRRSPPLRLFLANTLYIQNCGGGNAAAGQHRAGAQLAPKRRFRAILAVLQDRDVFPL